jgi:uncharacterized membrane protein
LQCDLYNNRTMRGLFQKTTAIFACCLWLQADAFLLPTQPKTTAGSAIHNRFIVRPITTMDAPTLLSSPTALHSAASLITPSNAQAALSLLLSTYAGVKIDQRLPGSGILATLSAASLLSWSRLAPAASWLYDSSWSVYLPASLVFLLLSLPRQTEASQNNLKAIGRLAVPFGIACAGSVLGCAVSYVVFSKLHAFGGFFAALDARLAASCLTASFVGGSVNFLTTAKTLVGGAVHKSTMLTSLAAADVLIMATYLSGLAACLQSKRLTNWFGSKDDSVPSNSNSGGDARSKSSSSSSKSLAAGSLLTAGISMISANVMIKLANRVEARFSPSLPGTACAAIAVATPLIQRLLTSTVADSAVLTSVNAPLARWSFLMVFAALGMSMNVKQVVQHGPACLVFSSLALLVHGAVTLVGSKLYKTVVDPSLTLADTLTASNAAIGGPTTAAAFAGQVSTQKSDLIVAGTFWGIVGYAIGTTVGLALFKKLPLLL